LALAGFALLNLNPFVLDFFSLARGYGLALGLSMGALFLLRLAWDCPTPVPTAVILMLSLLLASLADLANFTWINLHIALLLIAVLIVWRLNAASRIRAGLMTLLLIPNAWFLWNLVRRLWRLQALGELYFGGGRGLVQDTLGSLIGASLYGAHTELVGPLMAIFLGAITLAGCVSIHSVWTTKSLQFSEALMLLLGLALLAPLFEHRLFGSLYPIERGALVYLPLAVLSLVFVFDLDAVVRHRSIRLLCSAACIFAVGFSIINFSRTANPRMTLSWQYDSETKSVMKEVGRHFGAAGRQVRIGNSWYFAPTINFYRDTLHYDWLSPATRDPISKGNYDIIYCDVAELQSVKGFSVLQSYPQIGTVLVQVDAIAHLREP
jgi:hypothetical protein